MRASMVSGAIVVAALAAGSAGATSAKLLSFTTISHGSSQPTVSAERNFGKAFVDVISRVTDTGGWTNFVPKADATKIEGVKYQTHFVSGVLVPERTTGYSVTIKRITLQHISPSRRQFCIAARVDGPKPGEAILREGRYAQHTVRLSSRPFQVDQFHWSIPTTWVVRESRRKALGASTGPVTAGVGARTTGKVAQCRTSSRLESVGSS